MGPLSRAFRRLNQRERALVACILAAVALVAGKLFVVDELGLAREARHQAAAVEAEAARSHATLAEAERRKPVKLKDSPLWPYRLENTGVGNLIRKVSGADSRRDFAVKRISVEKTEKLPEYEKTRFEIEVEGPFHSIGSFLEELESSRFLTRVESVQVFRIERELRLCRARIFVNSFSWRDL
jgi:hypothetical protein